MTADDLRDRPVLVTGAGGFIGSHLTEHLVDAGADVHAFVEYNRDGDLGWLEGSSAREHVHTILGDVRDPDVVRAAVEDVEVVFHLAALVSVPHSYDAPASHMATNTGGTLNVLRAARDLEVERVVHTSSSEVYGTALTAPIDEDHPLQAQSPYAASKIGADKMAEAFHRSYGLPVATVRPFNTFGPRQSMRAIVPTIIVQALVRDHVELGNLHPTRDLNYVANTVEGMARAAVAEGAVGEVVNLGTGRDISIGDLAQLVIDRIDPSMEVRTTGKRKRPPSSEVERLVASNDLAEKLLGWTPRVSLEEGIEHTIRWIRNNVDLYDADAYRT